MIALELQLPENIYAALQKAAKQTRKSETEIALAALQTYLTPLTNNDPLLGLFADDPLLMDQVEADAMQARERDVLRLHESNGY